MRNYPFVTVDVFTETRFGGNQLAVFTDARGLSDAEMQLLAAEMNYSETTFVLPPDDPRNTARVRIFTRMLEMPFAGHPNVGTAFVLANQHSDQNVLRFEELAGLVEVRIDRDPSGRAIGAMIDAPQPLQLLGEFGVDEVASCIGLSAQDILCGTHAPTRASVGVDFVLVEVDPSSLERASPDLGAFKFTASHHPELGKRLSILLYSRQGSDLRARMFAPLTGTWEDPATGSANAALGALLLSLGDGETAEFKVTQGVEVNRPSQLAVSARRTADGVRASVGGACVSVLRGEARL